MPTSKHTSMLWSFTRGLSAAAYRTAVAVFVVVAGGACGGTGSSNNGAAAQAADGSTSPTAQKTTQVQGQAAMGPLRGAFVNAFALEPDGSFGANLGAVITQADGSFSLDVMVPAAGTAVAFTVQGGVYKDEATGEDVTLSLEAGAEGSRTASADPNVLQTWISDVTGTSKVAVTALTTMAAGYARQALASSQADIHTAIGTGKSQVTAFFSANGGSLLDFDFTTTLPLDLTVSTSGTADAGEASYGSILSGLSQLAHNTAGAPAAGLSILSQLVAITRQDAAAFAQAAAAAAASQSASGALDANLLVGDSLQTLVQLGLQLLKSLPVAIGNFLDSGRVHATLPPRAGPPEAPAPSPAMPVMVHGSAWSALPLAHARIRAQAINPQGSPSQAPVLAETITNADGAFGLALPAGGWVRLSASNANIVDPISMGQVALANDFSFSVDLDLAADNANQMLSAAINPVTTMLSRRFSALMAAGQRDAGAAMEQAQHDVQMALGMTTASVDLTTTQAIDLRGPVMAHQVPNAQVSLLCEGVSTALMDGSISLLPTALWALALDMGDGKLNSRDQAGAVVSLPPGTLGYSNFLGRLNQGIAATLSNTPSLAALQAHVGLTLLINPS